MPCQKVDEQVHTKKGAGDGLRHPADRRRRRRPREPQHRRGQHDGARDHGRQALLRDGSAVVPDVRPLEVGRRRVGHQRAAHGDADDDRNKRQRAGAQAPAALLVKRNRILLEEEVDDAVDVARVRGQERQHRFLHQHDERTDQVDGHDRVRRHPVFVRSGVQGPISRLVAQTLGSNLKVASGGRFLE